MKRWPSIKATIDPLLRGQIDTLSVQDYMQLYAQLCGLFRPKSESQVKVAAVYARLDGYLRERCEEVSKELGLESRGSEGILGILKPYLWHWRLFQSAAKQIDRVFNYINRHWVKLSQLKGNDVDDIYNLHLKNWRNFMLEPVRDEMTKALLQKVWEQRGDQIIENTLMKEVLNSLSRCSIYQTIHSMLIQSLRFIIS
jgi:hypothetical protein